MRFNQTTEQSASMRPSDLLKQKTAYEMNLCDWSSDVCSSDLPPAAMAVHAATPTLAHTIRFSIVLPFWFVWLNKSLYFAYSTHRSSRITVTRMRPGNFT